SSTRCGSCDQNFGSHRCCRPPAAFVVSMGIPPTRLAALLWMAVLTRPASAQSDRLGDIATYAGPDRGQRLIEGVRREGALTLYSNAPTDDNAALVGAFTKKYGIKVNLWRASSEEIRQRVLAEAKARRFDVDFILNNSPALEALRSEKILRPV